MHTLLQTITTQAPGPNAAASALCPAPGGPMLAPALLVQSLMAALDALDGGLMLCDARGYLLIANLAAQQELAHGGVLRLQSDGALNVGGGVGLLARRRAVHGAAHHGSQRLVSLRHGSLCLTLSVQPLQGPDGQAAHVLLLTQRRALCHATMLAQLGELHALTNAEQAVLAGLMQGTRIDVMARERQVALCTVRTQVAALRDKFGVQRVEDITRLVAALPPLRQMVTKRAPVAPQLA